MPKGLTDLQVKIGADSSGLEAVLKRQRMKLINHSLHARLIHLVMALMV